MSSNIKQLTKVVVSIALLFWAYSLIDISRLYSAILTLDSSYLVGALLVTFLGTIVTKSYLIWDLLNLRSWQKLVSLVGINLSLRFFSIVLPRPVVIAIRWYRYSQLCDARKALVILSIEVGTALLLIFLYSALFVSLDSSLQAKVFQWPLLLVAALSVLWIFSLPGVGIAPLVGLVTPVVDLMRRYFSRIFAKVDGLIDSAAQIGSMRYLSVKALGYNALGYFLFFISSYLLLLALDIELSFVSIVWIRCLVMLGTMLPISIGGIGIREIGLVYLMGLYGVDSESAVAYSLASYALQLGIGILGGIIEFNRMVVEYVKK